jgi:hypothetical protein
MMLLLRRMVSIICRPTRSLQELFAIIILVAIVSILVTYQVSKYVLQKEQAQLKIHFNGRVDIYRKFHLEENGGEGAGPETADKRHGLEGIDMETRPKSRKKSKDVRRPPTALEKKLRQVEGSLLDHRSHHKERLAILCGDNTMLERDGTIYSQTLKTAGFTVKIANGTLSCGSLVGASSAWTLLLCLVEPGAEMDQLCAAKQLHNKHLRNHQKVGYISSLHHQLEKKDVLCRIMTNAKHIPAIKVNQLYPQCFVMPAQFQEFLTVADAIGESGSWIFKPISAGNSRVPVQMLQPTKNRDFIKIKDLAQRSVLIQQCQDSPLLLFGMPFSVTAYVLVTSLSPLRAYLHSDGVIQYRHDYQRNFQK